MGLWGASALNGLGFVDHQASLHGNNSFTGSTQAGESTSMTKTATASSTTEILKIHGDWQKLPEIWRKRGELVLSYRTSPWLINEQDRGLVGALNRVVQWRIDSTENEKTRGIEILQKKEKERTSADRDFLQRFS